MIENTVWKEIEAFAAEGAFLYNEPLRDHTTFRVGGEADAFLSVQSGDELKKVLLLCKAQQIPYFVLGNGSNLLVSDKGFRGLIISIGNYMSEIKIEGKRIYVEAGALLGQVAQAAAKNGLTGMEFAAGIPGTVGGAIVMNAGAYDGEMKQIVETVTVMTPEGEIRNFTGTEMEFGYRTSRLKREPGIVLSVTLLLKEGRMTEIREKMSDFALRRREKQPLEYPSAGSTFKRPEGMFAGKLIMDAGLRGYTVGGARVSDKHCGFVINKDGATAEDINTLIKDVQEKVEEKFGVYLEPEVIFVGDFR